MAVQGARSDILAQHPGAHFLAAAEQPAAAVTALRLGLGPIIMLVRHDNSPLPDPMAEDRCYDFEGANPRNA
jgi:hypothetical protein